MDKDSTNKFDEFSKGNIKRFKIWNRALSPEEIKFHYLREHSWLGRKVNDLEYRREKRRGKMCLPKEGIFCPRDKCDHYLGEPTKYTRKCWHEPQCWKGFTDIFIFILVDWWEWKIDQIKGVVIWLKQKRRNLLSIRKR